MFLRPKLCLSDLRYVLTPCLCCSDVICVILARFGFLESAQTISADSR